MFSTLGDVRWIGVCPGKYHKYISECLELTTEGYPSSEGYDEFIRGVQYIVGIL